MVEVPDLDVTADYASALRFVVRQSREMSAEAADQPDALRTAMVLRRATETMTGMMEAVAFCYGRTGEQVQRDAVAMKGRMDAGRRGRHAR